MNEAKNYLDLQNFKIRWDKLLSDITFLCSKQYPSISSINFNKTEMSLYREIIFHTRDNDYSFYIGIDINGEDDIKFTFAKFLSVSYYTKASTLDELFEIILNNIIYL